MFSPDFATRTAPKPLRCIADDGVGEPIGTALAETSPAQIEPDGEEEVETPRLEETIGAPVASVGDEALGDDDLPDWLREVPDDAEEAQPSPILEDSSFEASIEGEGDSDLPDWLREAQEEDTVIDSSAPPAVVGEAPLRFVNFSGFIFQQDHCGDFDLGSLSCEHRTHTHCALGGSSRAPNQGES